MGCLSGYGIGVWVFSSGGGRVTVGDSTTEGNVGVGVLEGTGVTEAVKVGDAEGDGEAV